MTIFHCAPPLTGSIQHGQWGQNGGKDTEEEESEPLWPDPHFPPHLEQEEKLKDSSEGWREESGVGDGGLKEEGVEEAIPHVNERVLVHVGVPDPIWSYSSCVVIDRSVIVDDLILRHDLWLWIRD